MKPGATIQADASTTRAPGSASNRPMATIRSPRIATSAVVRGAPVPSTTVPPRSTQSAAIDPGSAPAPAPAPAAGPQARRIARKDGTVGLTADGSLGNGAEDGEAAGGVPRMGET